jgi:hypothetical protein
MGLGSVASEDDAAADAEIPSDSASNDSAADSSQPIDAGADNSTDTSLVDALNDPPNDTSSDTITADTGVLDEPDGGLIDAPSDTINDSQSADSSLDAPDGEIADASTDVADSAALDCGIFDASSDVADSAKPDVTLPDATAASIDSTTVAGDSLAVDRVRQGDGAISADGQMDGAFVLTAYGEIVGVVLMSTDATGTPSGGQQWDTYVGTTKIPAALGSGFSVGSSTWQLGVWEGTVPLNLADGSLTHLPLGPHTLHIYGSNSGYFVTGKHLRVVAELANGTLIRGPVVTY